MIFKQIPQLRPESPGISPESFGLVVNLIEQFDKLEAENYG